MSGLRDDEDAAGTTPSDSQESVAPFGVSQASDPDGEEGGQGLTFVLEITDIVDGLTLEGSFDVESLPVRLVPQRPVDEEDELSIGRISIFRQGR